jgi:hypothetical protein
VRVSQDEGDIVSTLRLFKEDVIPSGFEALDRERIYLFAKRFGQRDKLESLLDKAFSGRAHVRSAALICWLKIVFVSFCLCWNQQEKDKYVSTDSPFSTVL